MFRPVYINRKLSDILHYKCTCTPASQPSHPSQPVHEIPNLADHPLAPFRLQCIIERLRRPLCHSISIAPIFVPSLCIESFTRLELFGCHLLFFISIHYSWALGA